MQTKYQSLFELSFGQVFVLLFHRYVFFIFFYDLSLSAILQYRMGFYVPNEPHTYCRLLHERILRIVNKSKYDAHTDPIFKDLHMLKFHDIIKLQTGQLVFLCRSKCYPNFSMIGSKLEPTAIILEAPSFYKYHSVGLN